MQLNSNHTQKGVFLVAIAVLAVLLGLGLWKRQAILAKYQEFTQPTAPAVTEVPFMPMPETPVPSEPTPSVPTTPTKPEPAPIKPSVLPKEFNLAVPFIKQAPHAIWDYTHEETCEEAAVLTVHAYYSKLKLTDDEMEAELQKMIAVQNRLFGFFEDTTVQKTIEFAKETYGFTGARVIENPTIEDIKKEIYAGRPVSIPASGKLLKNPNFKNGGPLYHHIVARGWNEKGIFVNDPGTRKGENYFYTNAIIEDAIHDWSEADHNATGPKRVFVLTP